ncbi:MAG: hypothetical protein LBE24_07145 [Methylobacillus sp.]|jgi:hypothetical protein|nr:hypothetical protein [Methylobacillus sp.]
MLKFRRIASMVMFGLAVCFMGSAYAESKPAVTEPQIQQSDAERLTDLVLRSTPFDKIFQMFLNQNPNFPMTEEAVTKIDAAQLQCLRERMSPAGFRENRRQAVEQFIQQHPDQVQDAIQILEQVGVVIGAYFEMVTGFGDGGDAAAEAVAALSENMTPEKEKQFADFFTSDKYQPIYVLLLFDDDDASGGGFDKVAVKMLSEAMNNCNVSVSVLEE